MGDSQHDLANKSTSLYDRHVALGARMVPFGGWEMPLQYSSILQEHKAVREKVGIFDVSHMGRILFSGKDAAAYLDALSTNTILPKKEGMAIYTVLPNAEGGAVDDLILYKTSNEQLSAVVNASNRDKDLAHFRAHVGNFDVTITPRYEEDGILAVQGPKAAEVIGKLFLEATELKPMRFASFDWKGSSVEVARTGYTGCDGFELAAPHEVIVALWDELIPHCEPCGLGARDTLRLEAGFALYGHELTDTIAPTESVSAWTVRHDKHEFLGVEQMRHRTRKQYGAVLQERGIARQGCRVLQQGKEIGEVTSGSFAPTLNQAIAIVMVEGALEEGGSIEIEIRGKPVVAKVTPLPFLKKA